MSATAPDVAAACLTAARKTGHAWIGTPPRLLWCGWHDGSIVVIGDGPEQALPEIPGDGLVTVVVAASNRAGAASLVMRSEDVPPTAAEWPVIAAKLAERRRNGAVGSGDLPGLWARECRLLRLWP